jgi:hypothetical protein
MIDVMNCSYLNKINNHKIRQNACDVGCNDLDNVLHDMDHILSLPIFTICLNDSVYKTNLFKGEEFRKNISDINENIKSIKYYLLTDLNHLSDLKIITKSFSNYIHNKNITIDLNSSVCLEKIKDNLYFIYKKMNHLLEQIRLKDDDTYSSLISIDNKYYVKKFDNNRYHYNFHKINDTINNISSLIKKLNNKIEQNSSNADTGCYYTRILSINANYIELHCKH